MAARSFFDIISVATVEKVKPEKYDRILTHTIVVILSHRTSENRRMIFEIGEILCLLLRLESPQSVRTPVPGNIVCNILYHLFCSVEQLPRPHGSINRLHKYDMIRSIRVQMILLPLYHEAFGTANHYKRNGISYRGHSIPERACELTVDSRHAVENRVFQPSQPSCADNF